MNLTRDDMKYVREGQPHGPLAASYGVLETKGKAGKIEMGEREDWVTIERTKHHTGAAEVKPVSLPARGRPWHATVGDAFMCGRGRSETN